MTAPHLLSPVTFAGQELKNRMVLAPLTRGRAGPDREISAVLQAAPGAKVRPHRRCDSHCNEHLISVMSI